MTHPIVEANQRLYNKAFYKIYDEYHPNAAPDHYSHTIYRSILDRIARPNMAALDIGCGTGIYARHILRASKDSTLIANDISGQMLSRFATRLNDAERERVTFVADDAMEALNGHKYDLISIEGALHHFPEPFAVVRKAAQTLKPNGHMLIFNEPHHNISRRAKALYTLEGIATSMIFKRPGLAAKLYAIISPDVARRLERRVHGYPFDGEQTRDYLKSEVAGIDARALADTLEAAGLTTRTMPGCASTFAITHAIACVVGSQCFTMLAHRGET